MMRITIDYNLIEGTAILTNDDIPQHLWSSLFSKLNLIFSNNDSKDYYNEIIVPWRIYLRAKKQITNFCFSYDIQEVKTESAKAGISRSKAENYETAVNSVHLTKNDILKKLNDVGFERVPTDNQLNNLVKIANMSSAASFSVPGAGKTTEALSYFFLNAKESDKLLVVAPKNALISWDNELKGCVPSCKDRFIRLQGGEENIKKELIKNPRFMIITYQQLPRVKELLSMYMIKNSTFVFLDESHRIKAGESGLFARTALDLSILPIKKLVLSGTPMPQSTNDLVPQFKFLYPEKSVDQDNVVSLFEPVFVRTTAKQLGIPAIIYKKIAVKMSPLQRNIYDSLKSATKRELETQNLSDFSKDSLKRIGKCIIKVMQFVSNPVLLASDMSYIFNQELALSLMENDGVKLDETLKLARKICSVPGEKVVIWSTFVQNVELIAMRLEDLGANYINGSVITGDINDPQTREYRINKFLNDPEAKVLVANPAACSESISLHMACHNAIYMDRSFNAAHFMQSEDRIHRLGLKSDPIVYIIECEDSIDQLVDARLSAKIENMAKALNDSSIIISNYETNPESDEENNDDEDEDISIDDAKAIIEYFFKS